MLFPGQPLKINGIDPLDPLGTAGSPGNMPLSVDTVGCPYGNIIGTEKSDWHAPKITLDWFPTDDAMLYFSWARAIKPAGFNQVSSGGASPSTPSAVKSGRFRASLGDTNKRASG